MSAIKVVDASAIAAILFGEPDAEAVAVRLVGGRLVAPALLAFELANVCVVKTRREPDRQSALRAAFDLREGLGIKELPIDPPAVVALALETKLTAYDASYLWLARELGAELVTLDAALVVASASSP